MKIQINLPAKVEVEDYHRFSSLQDNLRKLNSKIKVREVGFNGSYMGIVYVGNLEDSENKLMFAEIKEESKKFDIENNS